VCKKKFVKLTRPTLDAILSKKEIEKPQVMVTPSSEIKSAVPLLLQLPIDFSNSQESIFLLTELERLIKRYQMDIGLKLPKIDIHWYGDLDDGWSLLAYEVPIAKGKIESMHDNNIMLEIMLNAIKRNVILFFGLQETSSLLTQLSADIPDIVKEVLRIIPVNAIAMILKNLVEEDIPIRNVRTILEALIEAGQHEKDVNNLTEYARVALRRQITHRYAPEGLLIVVALSTNLEDKLLESIRATSGKVQIIMQPDEVEKIIHNIVLSITKNNPKGLITTIQLRRHVRKMIENYSFNTPVLSHNELTPGVKVKVLDTVDLPETFLQAI
jgi:type III secretion protein V